MLVGRKYPIEVWRAVVATSGTGNWGNTPGDPTYSYYGTFDGTIQPFEASDGNRNNERFPNIRHLIICPEDTDVAAEDELVFKGTYERVSYVDEWGSDVVSHLEVYTTASQWDRR
jgi:hypothetical protein